MLSLIKNLGTPIDNTNKSEPTTYNIHEVAELLNVDYIKILYWCIRLQKELGMEYAGIDMKLTEKHINNLKLVKDLVLNKNYSTDKVKNILKSLEISSHVKEDGTSIPPKVRSFINKLESKFNFGIFFIQNKEYHQNEIAELLNVKESTIIYWFNCFPDKFSAPTVGVYQKFNKNDVKFFKKIKHLCIDKNYHMNEIKRLLS